MRSANQAAQQCEMDKAQLNQRLRDAEGALADARQQARKVSDLEKEGGVYDAARGTITVTLESNVLFSSGKVSLKNDSKTRLQRISSIIKRDYPGKEVWVIGHTDTDPIKKSKWTDNWQLSTERSLAVTRYLVQNGISAKQLVAAGRGEYHPISSSKAQNRRVEIVVYAR